MATGRDEQIAHSPFFAGLTRRAPQYGVEPRYQLGGGEGLDHVIVSPSVEPGETILKGAAGRDDDDGQGHAATAPAGQQIQPFAVRQPQVEEDRIRQTGGRVTGSVSGPAQPFAGDSFRPEGMLERPAEIQVVFDDQ